MSKASLPTEADDSTNITLMLLMAKKILNLSKAMEAYKKTHSKIKGDDGKENLSKIKAEKGKRGPPGPMPDHQWKGTKLRFELPNGEWGPFTDLRGPAGKAGKSAATRFVPAPVSQTLSQILDDLPLSTSTEEPTEVLIVQEGQLVRISFLQWKRFFCAPNGNFVTSGGMPVVVNGAYVFVSQSN